MKGDRHGDKKTDGQTDVYIEKDIRIKTQTKP